jgi:hypothetical protein
MVDIVKGGTNDSNMQCRRWRRVTPPAEISQGGLRCVTRRQKVRRSAGGVRTFAGL